MPSEQSNLQRDQTAASVPQIAEFRRRRMCEHGLPQSYLMTLTGFTIAATCLVSSAAAFTSAGSNSALKGLFHTSAISRNAPPRPFGVPFQGTVLPQTRLFAATNKDAEKAEWRAILAAFQMYKAAYGDLRVPTRFVVPSMPPWPGEFFQLCLVVTSLPFLLAKPHRSLIYQIIR